MKLSKKGLELIAEFEGFREMPYLDSAGVATIGYGNTYYPDGDMVTMWDGALTKKNGLKLLKLIVKDFEDAVNKLARPLNQNQFDALVSFTYNLGAGNLKSSTLLKRINDNPCDPDIKYQFSRWNKAGGRVLNGLVKRRQKEAELFFS